MATLMVSSSRYTLRAIYTYATVAMLSRERLAISVQVHFCSLHHIFERNSFVVETGRRLLGQEQPDANGGKSYVCKCAKAGASASCFVQARSANVSDPFDDVMIRVVQLRLEYFEVAHLQTRGSKGNLQKSNYSVSVMLLSRPLP